MSLRTPRGDWFSTSAAAAVAAVSVGVAVWLSLTPERLVDFYRLVGWTARWLSGGSLYGVDSDVDYPPWAIVFLSPLSLVPAAVAAPLWIACNLALLILVARTLSRRAAHIAADDDLGRISLMFLLIAAGAMRTLNQFTLLSLALGVGGASGNGALRPLWLGLSLIKPQIGGVFWVHAVWQRQWRLAGLALLVPLLLTVAYAWRADVALTSVPASYVQALALQYGDALTGQTELTVWLRQLVPGASGPLLAAVVACAVFGALAQAQPLLGLALASLLSLRHLSYDLVLLLPWLASCSGTLLWAVTLLLVADPAAVAGILAPNSWFAMHADRVVLTVGWIGALIWLRRPSLATGSDTIGHN